MDEIIDELDESTIKTQSSLPNYTFVISPHIHAKIENIIYLIKKFGDSSKTKQQWITEAINDKLSSENLQANLPKERRINFKIEEKTLERISKRVELISKYRKSFSKKQWVLEAIFEKLDKDEDLFKTKLRDANLEFN